MRQQANDNDESKWGRRRTLKVTGALGVAGITGLAGCGGNSSSGSKNSSSRSKNSGTGNTSTGSGSSGGSKPVDSAFTLAEWLVPKDAQYNSFNSKDWPGDASRMLYDAFVRYNAAEKKVHPNLLTDWNINGKTVTLKTRKQNWHNGDPVTAADVVAQLRLAKYMGDSKFLNSATTTGKHSAKLTLTDSINPGIFIETFWNKRLTVKKSLFEKHLKAFKNATTKAEKSKAQSKLSGRTIKKPVGNGPFQLKKATSQRFTLTKFDGHPQADNINFPRVVYQYYPSNQKRWQAMMNNDLDGQAEMFVPKNVQQKFPSDVERARIPTNGGFGLTFQHSNKDFGKRKVRQAVSHVVNRSQVASNSGGGTNTKVPVNIPCGIPGKNTVKQWLGSKTGSYNTYKTDTQRAASLLRDAGYEKHSGKWVDGNGKRLSAPFKVPSGYTDWVSAAKTIVSELQDFGIDSKMVSRSTSTFWGQDYAQGNFVLAAGGWSSRLHAHPYFHLKFELDSSTSKNVYNYPKTVSVPPVGNPNGTPQKVNVPKKVETLLTASKGSQTKQLVQELAWVANQTLPVLPIQQKLAETWLTTDDWNVPKAKSPKMDVYWPTSWLPRTGDLSAKTQ